MPELSLSDRISLPSALLKVPVNHPADALVVIDAAMTLLNSTRLEIVAKYSRSPALPATPSTPLIEGPKKRKSRAAKSQRKPRSRKGGGRG